MDLFMECNEHHRERRSQRDYHLGFKLAVISPLSWGCKIKTDESSVVVSPISWGCTIKIHESSA